MVYPTSDSEVLKVVQWLTDSELLAQLRRLHELERKLAVSALAHLGEVAARGLACAEAAGAGDLGSELGGLSEAEAQLRMRVARLVRDYPRILELFERAELQLAGIDRLACVITADNQHELLERARGRKQVDVEALVAAELKRARGAGRPRGRTARGGGPARATERDAERPGVDPAESAPPRRAREDGIGCALAPGVSPPKSPRLLKAVNRLLAAVTAGDPAKTAGVASSYRKRSAAPAAPANRADLPPTVRGVAAELDAIHDIAAADQRAGVRRLRSKRAGRERAHATSSDASGRGARPSQPAAAEAATPPDRTPA
jgi:hypothetical protein